MLHTTHLDPRPSDGKPPAAVPLPVYLSADMVAALQPIAEAECLTVTDYVRTRIQDIIDPPKEFEALFRHLAFQAKSFAGACANLPSVSNDRRAQVADDVAVVVLNALVFAKPQILGSIGLIESLKG